MTYQEFYLPKYEWVVFAFYDTTKDNADDVMKCLFEIGCSASVAQKAYSNLISGELNTGLTFSKKHQTCIVLGRASDKQNFAHTFTHEITHCAIHIAKEHNIRLDSEALAYIAGDVGAKMLPYASKFLCDHCNQKHNKKEE